MLGALAIVLSSAVFLSAEHARAATWQAGDFTTYPQDEWGGDPLVDQAAKLLVAQYDNVYASKFGILTVGSTSGFTMRFTDASSVLAYLGAVGPFAPLNSNVLNPITTASGGFGGEVTGLQLTVDFYDAGKIAGKNGLRYGDLLLTDFKLLPQLNGLSVRQFLADANILLGGGTTIFTLAEIGAIVPELNAAFAEDGTIVTDFAQLHLVAPETTSATPLPATLPLFVAGLGGFGAMCRRRRRKVAAA
jgi:hypothetical protein